MLKWRLRQHFLPVLLTMREAEEKIKGHQKKYMQFKLFYFFIIFFLQKQYIPIYNKLRKKIKLFFKKNHTLIFHVNCVF